MKAVVTVMLKEGVLDLAETDPGKAQSTAEEMARKLLANPVIESFKVVVQAE